MQGAGASTASGPWSCASPCSTASSRTAPVMVPHGGLQRNFAKLHRNVQRFRGGLVLKAHRLLHHSTLGVRVIKKKKEVVSGEGLDQAVREDVELEGVE